MEVKKKFGIIGAGIAGIALSIRLAMSGFDVVLFEKNDVIGGKLRDYSWEGFRWDSGPSLFTLPQEYQDLEVLCGLKNSEKLEIERLNIINKYFWNDGLIINSFSDIDMFATEIADKTSVLKTEVLDFFKDASFKYRMTKKVFLESSLHQFSTYVCKEAFTAYINIRKLQAFKTMHTSNAKSFKNSEKIIQLFDRFATYNGSNPYLAPATLNIIPHLEHSIGAYFPKNGMISIRDGLLFMLKKSGVEIKSKTEISSVLFPNNKKATLVCNGGTEYLFDGIVCGTDFYLARENFLSSQKRKLNTQTPEPSSSAFIFEWAIDDQFPELELHNIFFAENYLKEFNHIFKEKTFSEDVTVYLNISSKHNPNDAPKGKENWFVMVNAPCIEGQDFQALGEILRDNIISKLEGILKKEIKSKILHQNIITPKDIEIKTSSFKGALYGPSSNNKFSAFLRQSNKSSKHDNLFFVGGSVHPGGGIPLCLLSAKITASLIQKSFKD